MYTGSHWFTFLGGRVEGNCFHRCNLQSWTWQRSRWILAWRKWQILDTALQRWSLLSVAQLQNDKNTTSSAPCWFSKSRSVFGLACWHSVLLWYLLWHSASPPHLFLQVHWAPLPCTVVLVYTWNVQVLSSFVWLAGIAPNVNNYSGLSAHRTTFVHTVITWPHILRHVRLWCRNILLCFVWSLSLWP